MTTSDHAARERFAKELSRNFSVVASAGSGKTTAITRRVLAVACSAKAAEILPRLVVVTYANRAANEMQQRARQLILDSGLPEEVQSAFNRAFFGTIHSFCVKMLNEHGHHLGLPSPLELLTDDDDVWEQFVQSQTRIGDSLGQENRAQLLRFVQARDLMELARRAGSEILRPPELDKCPQIDFAEVYSQVDQGGRDNISKTQAELREWEQRLAAGWEFLRWPVCFTMPSAKFTALLRDKFAPLRKWVCDAAVCVAIEVQRAYRDFRLERGLVTYPDQIALAVELLSHPIAGARVREEGFTVILDEAQDTDPAQFSLLLETTRPARATGIWMETRTDPPQPGHFCMVGDFQQSIYRDPADLNYYRRVHDALIEHGNGEALEFSVTFRLDQKQLDFVNATFRDILNHGDGAVRFVELHPRPDILPGRVIRLPLGKELIGEGKKLKDYQKARIEAEHLARWIKAAGPERLCAASWSDVAILCPRKAWLQTMAAALRQHDLPVSVQSEHEVKGDSPAYAWLAALCTVAADALNGYEIAGVLREVFGVSDHDLAVFAETNKLRIDKVQRATGKVSSQLRLLAEARRKLHGLALFDAVSLLVAETQLRERLLLLPPAQFGDLGRELDGLLAAAADAEARGLNLSEFAQHLRDDFETLRPARAVGEQNAIQLITSHKAKGSEWQAVIVPFLGRELRIGTPRYPHLVKSPTTGELLIALGKEDKSKELKEAVERAQTEELQRLLYVATTRARRTLVIVLDQEIFANADGQLPKTAQLRRMLGGAGTYGGQFDAHSSTIDECAEFEAVDERQQQPTQPPPLPRVTGNDVQRALKRADDFVRKVNPSAYEPDVAIPETDETMHAPLRSRGDNLATLYGRWWHTFFQTLDWHAGLTSADAHFEKMQLHSPAPERSAREWKKTRGGLFAADGLASQAAGESLIARTELPFSWSMSQRVSLEGVIDLLLIGAPAKRCVLVDWKTNDIGEKEAAVRCARYLPQIAAYSKVVSEITGFDVTAGIFFTALGRWIPYQPGDLRHEWARLEKLPPNDLRDEVAVGESDFR